MAARKKNRLWIWFFVLVAIASVGAAGFMIWFNRHLQLTPERLEAAIKRWDANGPADYLMTYTLKLGDSARVDKFVVKVRGKRVIEVRMNGEPLRDADGVPIVDERLQSHSMDRLLRYIERFLQMDAQAKKLNYNFANFDEQTGALQSYIRRVGMLERVQEEVTLEPLPP